MLNIPRQARGYRAPQAEREVVRFLGEVASAAYGTHDRNAIQLPVATAVGDRARSRVNYEELGDELRIWLDEHPPLGPFANEEDTAPFYRQRQDLPQMLQQAMNAGIIALSTEGVLSFCHELLAEYFVAEHFFLEAAKQADSSMALSGGLRSSPGRLPLRLKALSRI